MLTFLIVLLLVLWLAGVLQIIFLPLITGKMIHIILIVIGVLLALRLLKKTPLE